MSIHLPPITGGGYIYTPSIGTTSSSQPRINPIAHFVSPPNDGLGNETFATSGDSAAIPTAGRLLAVNSHYIAYAVKKGLVRVIDRQSSAKALLRGHGCRIVDASFFCDSSKVGIGGLWSELANAKLGEFSTSSSSGTSGGAASGASDILATLGGLQDSLFIWRIYNDGELKADKLIELNFNNNTTIGCPGRILWHPFDPNRFLLLNRGGCTSAGSLVETKRLVTKRDEAGHMVCDCEGDIPGATKFIVDGGDEGATCDINDSSWSSKDARHVLTAHDHGVRLWDVIAVVTIQDEKSFQCIATLNMEPVTRVICLSQYETDGNAGITPPFVTGTDMNHTITLWSGFTSSGTSQKLRVFTLKSSPPSISTLLSVELCPAPYRPSDTTPSSFLLINERDNAQTHALHLATEWKPSGAVGIMGFDYVTTIDVVHPILSQCIAPNSDNTANLDEERDVDICCVQTKAVQLLTLSGEMVAPPKSLDVPNSITLIEEEEKEDISFEEDYDMDEEVEEAEFSTEHDADSEVVKEEPASVDPFSNWLGAIGRDEKPAGSPPSSMSAMPTPPPPGLDFMFPPPPGMAESSSLLSPMEILGSKNEPFPDPLSSTSGISKSNAIRKKEGRKSPPMAILQRQEKETRSASHPSGNNADMRMIEGCMERILANHMKSMESKIIDTLKKTVSSEVDKAIGGKKVKSTMEKAASDSATVAAKEAVSSMQAPMVTALNQTMREILIPAYEAATTQMFHQIAKSVDQGLAKIAASQSSQPSIETVSKQMAKMAEAIQTLSSEIAQLKSEGVNPVTNNATRQVAKQAQSKQADIRQEILALCQSRRYEDAFAKAVSAANGDVVVFTCKNADITAVGFDGEVTLSQTILICLMQQLGAVLVSATDPADFKIIVTWLQEIAVTIDPTNESIQRRELKLY